MTKFIDGPAHGVTLQLKRAPRFLRVVFSTNPKEPWDALDQLEDTPTIHEMLYAYEVEGEVGRYHILRRPTGSGWYMIANYRFIPEQPADEEMRETDAWRQWCEAHK